jgi:hypothetical protein
MIKYIIMPFILTLRFFAVQGDCPSLVQTALKVVDEACSDTARNQACYGNIVLTVVPVEGASGFAFSQKGDRIDVTVIHSLQLSSMSLADGAWGVALMKLQANLPDTLPGQNVTFLLFGDVQIENATEVRPELTLSVTHNVNVRLSPTTGTNNIILSIHEGQEVVAVGRLEDSSWVQIKLPAEPNQFGWISADFVHGDISALAVVKDVEPRFGPMEAFYFKSGIGDRPCNEAPDSGILVQTPAGAGTVSFTANGVEITLGSTVYMQAGGGFMVVSILDGQAQLTVFGVTRVASAGSSIWVPLGPDGRAAAPPQLPQPYDFQALQTLPVNLAIWEAFEIAQPLLRVETATAPSSASAPATPGLWRVTAVLTESCTGVLLGRTREYEWDIRFAPDGALIGDIGSPFPYVANDEFLLPPNVDGSYTSTESAPQSTSGSTPVIDTINIIFTSPTTVTGEWIQLIADCERLWSLSGELVSPA